MLQSIWVHTQDSPHEWRYYLIDPANYQDCETGSEMAWRITTGKSHREYCVAHAKALRDIATRLLEAITPPQFLALPAPDYAALIQERARAQQEREKAKPKPKRKLTGPETALRLGINYDQMILNPRRVRDGVGRACVTLAGDHEYIEAMFRVYTEGRTRLLM